MLRYRADVSPKSARVGIVEVDRASPFASLSGTDNQHVVQHGRYRDWPPVPVAAVLNDVLALAGGRRRPFATGRP